jgi:hypothetical protein
MLKIIIIGTQDIKQKALTNRVKQAIESMMIEATIVEITNLDEILAQNIIQTPALVIRDQVLSQGIIPQVADLKILIAAFLPDAKKKIEPIVLTAI